MRGLYWFSSFLAAEAVQVAGVPEVQVAAQALKSWSVLSLQTQETM
jgi:hypothetical protein